jgi:hypothetical protein
MMRIHNYKENKIMENKSSFFSIFMNITAIKNNKYQLDELHDSMDLILNSMGLRKNCYRFEQITGDELVYYFQPDNRKRKGQLKNYCEKYLISNTVEYRVESLSKFSFESEINRLRENKNFKLMEEPSAFEGYHGEDIAFFNNRSNWYPWQTQIYNLLFDDNGSWKKPDPRKIISIIDVTGNSGKSSFFKFLLYNHANEIGKMGYGTAAQLRSSVINIGEKKLYLVDLPRSKSRDDKQEDLLSQIEDCKNGSCTSSMRGEGKILLMSIPHVILSSNYTLKYELLSSDRWEVYEITKSKTLKKIKVSSGNKLVKK